MSKFEFLIPYVLENPIFPKKYITDVKLVDLCFNKILEIYISCKVKQQQFSYLSSFYNMSWTNESTCVRFLIPPCVHFLCDILQKSGTEGLSKFTYKLYIDFWNKKPSAEKLGVYFLLRFIPLQYHLLRSYCYRN